MANTTGKKFGGREKGTPNKQTKEIKEAFQLLVSSKIPKLSKWLDEVAKDNPEKALDIIVKFSDFIIPKLSRQEIKNETTIEAFLLMSNSERQQKIFELEEELRTA